jgi:hypothetical protein
MKSGALTAKKHSTLCIFAGFSAAARVEPYVICYIEALKACEMDIVFVQTTNSTPAPDAYSEIEPLCRGIMTRPNVGYDFVSWRTGIETCPDLAEYEHLVLTNDSVLGPFRDLAPLVSRMRLEPALLWGMTDCSERGMPHLQSYFLLASREIFSRDFFFEFWRSVVPAKSKGEIIDRFEIGFSQRAVAHGIQLRAIFPSADVRRRALNKGTKFQYQHELQRAELNPTLFAWDILVEEMGFPFIKTELLRDNRFHSERVSQWREIVGARADSKTVAAAQAFVESSAAYKRTLLARLAHHYRQLSGIVRDLGSLDFAAIRHKVVKIARRLRG